MDSFFIGLQFLTRIHVVKQTEWTEEAFGKSVRYFPLVGLTLGLVYGAAAWMLTAIPMLYSWEFPVHVRAALLAVLPFLLTGGIHCDGFMDTVDGIFSGRARERMLEIMKDSHVGSNAVIALVCLVLLKVAAYTTLAPLKLTYALVAMYICTRTFMVSYIVNYPYARKTGIGHMFKAYAKPVYTYIAFALCIALVYACGLPYLYTAVATFLICQGIAQFLCGQLGGLTGDTYGFLTECGVVVYLLLATYLL